MFKIYFSVSLIHCPHIKCSSTLSFRFYIACERPKVKSKFWLAITCAMTVNETAVQQNGVRSSRAPYVRASLRCVKKKVIFFPACQWVSRLWTENESVYIWLIRSHGVSFTIKYHYIGVISDTGYRSSHAPNFTLGILSHNSHKILIKKVTHK